MTILDYAMKYEGAIMTNYKCLNCNKEFMVKEYVYQAGIIVPQQCPFCGSYDIEESEMFKANSNAVLDDGWRDARKDYPRGHNKNYIIWDGNEQYTAWSDSHCRTGWRDLMSGIEIDGVIAYRELPEPPASA